MYSMSIYWRICSQCSSWDQDCSWQLRATVFIISRCLVSGSFHQPSMLGDIHSGPRRSSDCDWLFGLQGHGDRKWHASHFPEWRLEFAVWWNMLWTCWKMSMNYAACRHSLFRSSGYFLTVWQRAMMAAWGSAQITLPVLTQVYCKCDLSNFFSKQELQGGCQDSSVIVYAILEMCQLCYRCMKCSVQLTFPNFLTS